MTLTHVTCFSGIYRNFTEGIDKNALCDETELSTFCKHVSVTFSLTTAMENIYVTQRKMFWAAFLFIYVSKYLHLLIWTKYSMVNLQFSSNLIIIIWREMCCSLAAHVRPFLIKLFQNILSTCVFVGMLLLSFAFTISNIVSAANWRPHHVLGVVLRCHRRSKSTGTRSQYASLFGVDRSRRVARRCNPTHACCCGMVPHLIGTCLAGSIGHGAGPFPVAGW